MADNQQPMDTGSSTQEESSVELEEENPFSALQTDAEMAKEGDADSGIVEMERQGSLPKVRSLLLRLLCREDGRSPMAAEIAGLSLERLGSDSSLRDAVAALLLSALTAAEPASAHATQIQGAFRSNMDILNGTKELGQWRLLLKLHANVCAEQREQARKAAIEGCDAEEQSVQSLIREQLLLHLTLLLTGAFSGDRSLSRWLLLRGLLLDEVTEDLYRDLFALHTTHPHLFTAVWSDVAEELCAWGQCVSLATDEFRRPLQLLERLTATRLTDPASRVRPFCTLLVRHPRWLGTAISDRAGGRELARTSLLGPFLSLSAFAEDGAAATADHYFPPNCDDDTAAIAFGPLRNQLASLGQDLHRIFHNILVNAESRQGALDFLAAAVEKNARKAQMQVDDSLVAPDAFMLNLLRVLYALAEKVTMDKVEVRYPFLAKARVSIKEEARLKMDQSEAEEFLQSIEQGSMEVNFPSECFFLTIHAQHLSVQPALSRHDRRLRAIHQLEGQLRKLEDGGNANAEQGRRVHAIKFQLAKLRVGKWVGEAWLADADFLGRALGFAHKQLRLLTSLLISPGEGGRVLGEGAAAPALFRALPNFYMEDPLDLLLSLERNQPQVLLESPQTSELLPQLLVLICSTQNVKSPFLAAKAIEFLFYLSPRIQPANERLWNSVLCLSTLPPFEAHSLYRSLTSFYADCELTGSHTEFFDKFNMRYHVQVLFSCMWKNGVQRHIMVEQSREGGNSFVMFVSMVINDTTFLLDESLQALGTINEIETLMEKPEWKGLSPEEQKAKKELLAQHRQSARSFLQLARETLLMFGYLTADLAEAFLTPLLGKRLATMLNYNMAQLCGPKCSGLKVRDPATYGWKPRELLQQLTDIYLHLDSDKFAEYIAGDERSYSRDMFQNIVNRLAKSNIVAVNQVERMRLLGERVFVKWQEMVQTEEDLGEVPDELADPIMGTLMRDPVKLPSGHVMDREVIQRHLIASGPINPFNREELREDQLLPDTETKARVEAWIEEKKHKTG